MRPTSPLNVVTVPVGVPAGTVKFQMKKPFWPGATAVETVAYTVLEYQPEANAAFGEATLHVTLSARHTRRPTMPGCHVVVPSLKKMTENWPEAPAGKLVNTDSPE
jgi:hypothetical protein